MSETRTIFESDEIKVSTTGHDYDFVATVENKTDEPLAIAPENPNVDGEFFEPFVIEAGGWAGVLANDDGDRFMRAAETMSLDIAGPERFDEINTTFGTDFGGVQMER